jgi:hypothetical protein
MTSIRACVVAGIALVAACAGSTIESGGFKVQKDYTVDAFAKVARGRHSTSSAPRTSSR